MPLPLATSPSAAGMAAAPAGTGGRFATRLAAAVAAERDRWFLWLPVLVGVGIAVYFALPAEPPVWAAGIAVALAAGLLPVARARQRRRGGAAMILMATAALAIAGGFFAAAWRSERVEAPRLTARAGPLTLTGRVSRIEALPAAARVTFDEVVIRALPPERTPARIRLRFPEGAAGLAPGDVVRLKAVLSPLPPPTSPGAFDFQRFAYFQRLGALGFVVGDWERPAPAETDRTRPFAERLARLRLAIGERIRAAEPGAAGEMMVALITGEQTGLPPEAMAALRDAGLAHLLSISGLHIGLAGGFLFFWVRALIAAVPWLCLRVPAKKLAAAVAIGGAALYMLLAAAPVPTQRAFFMLTIVMLAVIFDRRAVSMRLVAWAALIILLSQPEALLGASFQMSFAAMVALIAGYEEATRRRFGRAGEPAPLGRAALYLGSILASTIIATLATAPFGIYHFGRLALFGALANLIAIPITGFLVMPAAVLAVLLMPFGGEALPLRVMAAGTGAILEVAEWAAALPAAALRVPALPVAGLALISLGGLWLCLWRRRWRLLGLAAIGSGMLTILWVQPPDILIEGQGGLIGVRLADGRLAFSSPRAAGFARRAWQQRLGEDDAAPGGAGPVWPGRGMTDDGRLACDPLGCILTVAGKVVALPRRAAALIEDCRGADLIVAASAVRPCGGAVAAIDAAALARGGGHAVWLRPAGIRIASVNASRGRRPWVPAPAADRNDPGDEAPGDE